MVALAAVPGAADLGDHGRGVPQRDAGLELVDRALPAVLGLVGPLCRRRPVTMDPRALLENSAAFSAICRYA
jgi:hypothetical protein